MLISDTNFSLAQQVKWDGTHLYNKIGYKMKCIAKTYHYKLYVNKTWSGNGFGNDNEYFIVNTKTNEILRYDGSSYTGLATDIVKFLERKSYNEI